MFWPPSSKAFSDRPHPELVEGRTMSIQRLAWIIAIVLCLIASPAFAAPDVVVSINPSHALVAGVMADIGEPGLIISGGTSPHLYTLRPRDAEALQHANLVFWVGPTMEGFLIKPLQALAGNADIVELDRAPGVALLPARQGGAWEADEDEPAGRAGAGALEQDGHLWLDPRNAKAIARWAAARLAAHDPGNAARYAANDTALEQRLDALDAELRQRLAPIDGAPFVVFHDAYQYLERRYGLAAIGSITVSPEQQPGGRRVSEIRARIVQSGVRCVFREPQFVPHLVDTLIAGTAARQGVLDPEGTAMTPGRDLYFHLMDGLADALIGCLAAPR